MKINFKGTNIELTPEIKNFAEQKLRSMDRLVSDSKDEPYIQLEIGRTTNRHKHGEVFRAEVNFHLSGYYFRAEAVADDLFSVIDQVRSELQREIDTGRKKREAIFRRSSRRLKNLIRSATSWPPFRRR